MRKIIALVAALLVALILAGCDSSDTSSENGATESSGPAAIGAPVDIDEASWDLTATVHSAEWKSAGQGETANQPNNGAFLVIDVEVSGDGSYSPLYFTFRADTGVESDAFSGIGSGYKPTLGSGDLAGGLVRGFVTFDAAQAPGVIILTDPLGGTLGSWTIPG